MYTYVWNVEFAKDLNAMNGSVLSQEKIFERESQVSEWCACLYVLTLLSAAVAI